MNNAQYFLHLTNDHRICKNKLAEELSTFVRKQYNHTLTNSLQDMVDLLFKVVDTYNRKFPRCKPLRCDFQAARDRPGSYPYLYIPELLTVNFYEVKPSP